MAGTEIDIPHFEPLRSAFVAFNAQLAGPDLLGGPTIDTIYSAHFAPTAFPSKKVKSRPQYNQDQYPSLYETLDVLRGGQPIDCEAVPAWKNWEDVNKALVDNPLGKLLLGFIWKQGDINTLRHVFRGLHGEAYLDKDGVVMYQFGRHLGNPSQQPIFDQHTYRAYRLIEVIEQWEIRSELKSLFDNETGIQKGNTLPTGALHQYLTWWNNRIAPRFPPASGDRLYALAATDRLLFSLGKAAKLQANS